MQTIRFASNSIFFFWIVVLPICENWLVQAKSEHLSIWQDVRSSTSSVLCLTTQAQVASATQKFLSTINCSLWLCWFCGIGQIAQTSHPYRPRMGIFGTRMMTRWRSSHIISISSRCEIWWVSITLTADLLLKPSKYHGLDFLSWNREKNPNFNANWRF